MTPRGKPITQARIREIASGPGVTILCGRFEGFDERLFDARPQIERSASPISSSPAERWRRSCSSTLAFACFPA
jgi:hypothetical protein